MSEELTERERQVVRLVSLGCNLEEIGRILKLAANTVDNHKSRAMAKLGTDKAALMSVAARKGASFAAGRGPAQWLRAEARNGTRRG